MGRLQDLFARGVVLASAGAKKMRELQVRLLADEVRDELEHVEPYGFTSEPKDDGKPEAFALFFDGELLSPSVPGRFFGHNRFYTTAARRISEGIFENAVTVEDVIKAGGGQP